MLILLSMPLTLVHRLAALPCILLGHSLLTDRLLTKHILDLRVPEIAYCKACLSRVQAKIGCNVLTYMTASLQASFHNFNDMKRIQTLTQQPLLS